MGGMDGTDGKLLGRGWDGLALAGAGMEAPTLVLEQERHHWLLKGGGLWEVMAGTNFVGDARARSICVR